jgi:hypothetical protein
MVAQDFVYVGMEVAEGCVRTSLPTHNAKTKEAQQIDRRAVRWYQAMCPP